MKILILGLSCSGKTTLSNFLSSKMNIPCFHLDNYYWKSCWIKNPDFDINQFFNLENWILDGNYFDNQFIERLATCDIIVYLVVPLATRMFRMIRRHLKYKKNPEKYNPISSKINLKFIFSTIKKHLVLQPKILRLLNNNYKNKLIVSNNIRKFLFIENEEDIYKLFYTDK